MNRKQLLVIGVLVVVLPVAILVPSLLRHSKPLPTTTPVKGLVITNINQYGKQFDGSVIPQIEQTVFNRVKASVKKPATYYAASVRPGSFNIQNSLYEGTDPPMSVPTVNFIVDIPVAQRTYVVKFSGGTNYPYKILYVLCPTPSQNRYAPFKCQDPGQ